MNYNFILSRRISNSKGIFGVLKDDSQCFCTLEHAYPGEGKWAPKVPEGKYECVKSWHRLSSEMDHAFQTFEVMNVPGHSGILFHQGNFNKDSEGCILLGNKILHSSTDACMIMDSVATFNEFMSYLKNVDKFTLTVQNEYQ